MARESRAAADGRRTRPSRHSPEREGARLPRDAGCALPEQPRRSPPAGRGAVRARRCRALGRVARARASSRARRCAGAFPAGPDPAFLAALCARERAARAGRPRGRGRSARSPRLQPAGQGRRGARDGRPFGEFRALARGSGGRQCAGEPAGAPWQGPGGGRCRRAREPGARRQSGGAQPPRRHAAGRGRSCRRPARIRGGPAARPGLRPRTPEPGPRGCRAGPLRCRTRDLRRDAAQEPARRGGHARVRAARAACGQPPRGAALAREGGRRTSRIARFRPCAGPSPRGGGGARLGARRRQGDECAASGKWRRAGRAGRGADRGRRGEGCPADPGRDDPAGRFRCPAPSPRRRAADAGRQSGRRRLRGTQDPAGLARARNRDGAGGGCDGGGSRGRPACAGGCGRRAARRPSVVRRRAAALGGSGPEGEASCRSRALLRRGACACALAGAAGPDRHAGRLAWCPAGRDAAAGALAERAWRGRHRARNARRAAHESGRDDGGGGAVRADHRRGRGERAGLQQPGQYPPRARQG